MFDFNYNLSLSSHDNQIKSIEFTSSPHPNTHRLPRYHPLYITSDPSGGFGEKMKAEQQLERVFAGVAYSNYDQPNPTAGEFLEPC